MTFAEMSARLSAVSRESFVPARIDCLDERHELIACRRAHESHPGVFVTGQQHDRGNVLDAVLRGPVAFEDEIDLFDANRGR